jgi:Trk K+ transport system NAD-binding subunit
LYGDAYDLEFLEEMHLDKAKIIVSTIPDFETNLLLLETIRKVNKDAIVILRSDKIEDAFYLYRKKANYVLTPHFLGGEYVAKMISSLKSEKHYDEEKSKHLEILKEMLERNKDHPSVERG